MNAMVDGRLQADGASGIISKAVIPVAGLGTRLTPAAKEQPKEMLPVFTKGANGQICPNLIYS